MKQLLVKASPSPTVVRCCVPITLGASVKTTVGWRDFKKMKNQSTSSPLPSRLSLFHIDRLNSHKYVVSLIANSEESSNPAVNMTQKISVSFSSLIDFIWPLYKQVQGGATWHLTLGYFLLHRLQYFVY